MDQVKEDLSVALIQAQARRQRREEARAMEESIHTGAQGPVASLEALRKLPARVMRAVGTEDEVCAVCQEGFLAGDQVCCSLFSFDRESGSC